MESNPRAAHCDILSMVPFTSGHIDVYPVKLSLCFYTVLKIMCVAKPIYLKIVENFSFCHSIELKITDSDQEKKSISSLCLAAIVKSNSLNVSSLHESNNHRITWI